MSPLTWTTSPTSSMGRNDQMPQGHRYRVRQCADGWQVDYLVHHYEPSPLGLRGTREEAQALAEHLEQQARDQAPE